MIKILFAEDNEVVRHAVSGILQKQPDLEIVGEAKTGFEALQLLDDGLQPDILLTDYNMPQMNGIQLVQQIAERNIILPTIVLTMHTNNAFMKKALEVGVRGYLLKNGNMDELFHCVRNVHLGRLVIGEEFR